MDEHKPDVKWPATVAQTSVTAPASKAAAQVSKPSTRITLAFDAVKDALTHFTSFTGDSNDPHLIEHLDENGRVIASKRFRYHTDEKGVREVRTFSRHE